MPRICCIEPRLHVADLQRAIAFYHDVLGFTLTAVFPEAHPTFAMMLRDGVGIQLGGIGGVRGAGDPSTCTLWIDVEDVLALHAAVSARVAIEWGPEVYLYGRRELGFRDPDGNLIVLSEETDDPVTCREQKDQG
jgi:catechol 2,3-dioxygenase-like lactoylglutathione lyase family enzyme